MNIEAAAEFFERQDLPLDRGGRQLRHDNPGGLLHIAEDPDAVVRQHFSRDRAGGDDGRGVAAEKNPAPIESSHGPYFVRRVRSVARPRSAVGAPVLLDVLEVPVQVRDQDDQRRAVREPSLWKPAMVSAALTPV